MIYYVYAIKSIERNYIYVGMTDNLERRIAQHNNKREQTTRPYAPFKIIYTKEFDSRNSARQEEKRLKSGFGKEFLKSLI